MHAFALAAAMVYAEPQPMKWRSGQRSIYIFSKDKRDATIQVYSGDNFEQSFNTFLHLVNLRRLRSNKTPELRSFYMKRPTISDEIFEESKHAHPK